ncbi:MULTISPECIES: GGDEF domain-containing protein [unclassified Pseudoxanthomonas]|uniref:sensor domain-containing diguanylate cyclase n=1 Tax=unclassified Pseudoxanthomonas TaxID=2645906 RepID=UPI0030776BD4
MFVRSLMIGLVMGLGAALLPLEAMGSDWFEKRLRQAESARSSDPKAFQEILGQLNAREEKASPPQKEQLQYLNAYARVFQGRPEQAIPEARQLIAVSTNFDMKFRAGALIVNAHALNRQFVEGLRQLEETLALMDRVRSSELRHQGLGVAALIHSQIGQHKVALHYAERILGDEPTGRTYCLARQVKLQALQNLAILPGDETVFNEAIDQCLQLREYAAANFIRITLARKWAAEGQREMAISLLERHLPEVEATRYQHLVGEVKALLAELMLEKGETVAAERYALGAIALNTSIHSSLTLASANKTMYEIAQRRGDTQTALSAYKSYAEADKAYLNEIKAREMAYQIVRQETLQKSQQISLLDKQNQVLQLQSKLDQKSAQNTRLIVMLLVMLVASIGYWAYKIKRVQLSLKQMAETDALTGVCNRHHFTLQAERALAQCARAGEEVSLIMFDLDHFKLVNDRYGHQTGDWVLKQVADACKGFCRRIDVLGRLGGEEFAILMYGCDLRGATRVAEDCRVRLAQIDSRETGHTFAVTASFGVTSSALSGYSLAKLLSHADKVLYRAKHLGRNRVCMFEGALAPLHEGASNVLELPHRHDERLESLRS